jgi:hypothetical protein
MEYISVKTNKTTKISSFLRNVNILKPTGLNIELERAV